MSAPSVGGCQRPSPTRLRVARGSAFVLHPVADSRREGLDVDPRGAATGEGVGERRLHPGLWLPIASRRAATHRGRRFPRRASRFPFSHLGGVRRESGEKKWQGPRHLSTNGEIKSFVLGRGQCWVQRSEGRSPHLPRSGRALQRPKRKAGGRICFR